MAAEPTTSSAFLLTGVVGAWLGPVYGPSAMMLFGALIGALLALSNEKTESYWHSIRFVSLAVCLSLVLTGAGVWLVERFTPLPGSLALMPVAALFAAGRSKIIGFISDLLDVAVKVIAKRGGAAE